MLTATITPLVMRHVTDAAFYWLQLDQSETAFRLPFERVMLFNERLDAHLEGLAIAGSEGIDLAFAELDRWRKPGEVFVCTWLAGLQADEKALNRLTGHLVQQPDALLRGAISAIARLPGEAAQEMIHRWTQPEATAPLQVAALRALALRGSTSVCALDQPLTAFIQSSDPFVRAAACRALARIGADSTLPLLHEALLDDNQEVCAEAAIALTGTSASGKASSVLWHCVNSQTEILHNATGWFQMQAMRRLNRWLRYLAWLTPFGYDSLPALFDYLPTRAGLTFALYHGDTSYLPRVIAAMALPATERYAGWVWQTLTGIDLENNGLTLPEPPLASEQAPITEVRLDADGGLPIPNIVAIQACPVSTPTGVRTLLGRKLTTAIVLDWLATAPQPIRAVAAHYLRQTRQKVSLNIRADTAMQKLQLEALRAQLQL
ncbi:MAG: HEAT repeat domain-containing protein [Candidatus Thiodiazotropha sp. (ex Lucinoma kastoroae)]|nr:HEAT repeat domain-containing protein [Candidatus Thiodiazotropha sp. (ex Lucinoma kastoroae)]